MPGKWDSGLTFLKAHKAGWTSDECEWDRTTVGRVGEESGGRAWGELGFADPSCLCLVIYLLPASPSVSPRAPPPCRAWPFQPKVLRALSVKHRPAAFQNLHLYLIFIKAL